VAFVNIVLLVVLYEFKIVFYFKTKTEIEMFEIRVLRRIFGEGGSDRRLEKTT
jgi:hypothetical protein